MASQTRREPAQANQPSHSRSPPPFPIPSHDILNHSDAERRDDKARIANLPSQGQDGAALSALLSPTLYGGAKGVANANRTSLEYLARHNDTVPNFLAGIASSIGDRDACATLIQKYGADAIHHVTKLEMRHSYYIDRLITHLVRNPWPSNGDDIGFVIRTAQDHNMQPDIARRYIVRYLNVLKYAIVLDKHNRLVHFDPETLDQLCAPKVLERLHDALIVFAVELEAWQNLHADEGEADEDEDEDEDEHEDKDKDEDEDADADEDEDEDEDGDGESEDATDEEQQKEDARTFSDEENITPSPVPTQKTGKSPNIQDSIRKRFAR